ncbi:MAG TPA: carbamoyltransferase HypF [Anaerobutyricum hallii]|uniref:carbamoyltransferase HypF n=1 Tax=Anaerobutyricum hallii TaxID=39488 RepID=UPI00242C8D5C|nr:carbamoyltransferase HypF [Anaerobutyricum hallii]HJH97200.1 carbamoyltransferase HypF [Anaerobutyricum hallii]
MRVCIRVFGIVQGVGFRPTVKRHADACDIAGSVSNKGPYVEIFAEGSEECVHSFIKQIQEEPPKRAVILKLDVENVESGEDGIHKVESETDSKEKFQIIESEKEEGEIFVSPDIAICPECKKELYDKNDRRYLHPFINCTCCGPRLTILDSMPYDRVRTSMGEFPMCEKCEYEYTHAETRRFDAQPVCCNDCGPEVYLLGRKERGADAIRYTRKVISEGGIVAVKGIGGFHLCCDAAKEETVARLRQRKKRPMKPFAVMMKDLDVVRRECETEPHLEEILDGHQKPIILLPKKEGGTLCESVAPDNPKIGVMLPYAPVQLLLFDYQDETKVSDCLVMTSANTSGAPICRDDEDALNELSGLCDVILSHDRKIRLRADDTVMDFYRGEPYMIRRSRGYAPLPFMMGNEFKGQVLAVGGELKNAFCIGKNQLFYPSPYIGDMGDVRTVKALKESVKRMEELLETKPQIVACDMHPSYNTRAAAEEMGLPVFLVQHHYAHILSCMAENEWTTEKRVIGVSFDGTGYGTDGTIWGGEILLADYDSFTRWGCIEPFAQTGGDASAKEGWRIAVSLLGKIYGKENALLIIETLGLCESKLAKLQFTMEERGINTVQSTSAGRLFDAVSAILDIRKSSTFEGEASTSLQFAAEKWLDAQKKKIAGSEDFAESGIIADYGELKSIFDVAQKSVVEKNNSINRNIKADLYYLPTLSLVKELAERKLAGENSNQLALHFHRRLAGMIVSACEKAREEIGINTVALSGGVYQNKLLLDYSVTMLEERGFHVLRHHLLPPNDGGISLGQAVAAMRSLQKGE